MKKPINSFIVWTTVPLAVYALIDIASNIRGLQDKYQHFISGYSVIRDVIYVLIPKLAEQPSWLTAYIATGLLFKSSLILLKLLHPYEKQPSWGVVLITIIRHVLAWPIVLLNFILIGFIAWRRGDYRRTESDIGEKNYKALAYVKSIYQYIGIVMIGLVVSSVAIGAW
ncbi:hypothetical protein AB6D81_21215 [Vibrio splendidus]